MDKTEKERLQNIANLSCNGHLSETEIILLGNGVIQLLKELEEKSTQIKALNSKIHTLEFY